MTADVEQHPLPISVALYPAHGAARRRPGGLGLAVSALGVGGSIKDSFFSWMPGWALDPFPAGAGQSDGTANVVTAVRRLPPLEAVGRRQPGLILAPMVHAVWRLKDVRIGIAVHITLNTLALPNVLPRLLG